MKFGHQDKRKLDTRLEKEFCLNKIFVYFSMLNYAQQHVSNAHKVAKRQTKDFFYVRQFNIQFTRLYRYN